MMIIDRLLDPIRFIIKIRRVVQQERFREHFEEGRESLEVSIDVRSGFEARDEGARQER